MAKNFTFTLNEDVQRRFKGFCVDRGVSLSKRIEELMKHEIDGELIRFDEIEKRLSDIDTLLISANIGEKDNSFNLDDGDGSGF